MAREVKTITLLTDDIDGSEATEAIDFAWRGTHYSIDLNDVHAKGFWEAVEPFIARARIAPQPQVQRRPGKPPTTREAKAERMAVRAWAQSQGIAVGVRGRVSRDLIERYHASQTSSPGLTWASPDGPSE